MKTLTAIIIASLATSAAAQTSDFVERVQQREFEVLQKGTCSSLLDDLEDRLGSGLAAMTCSLARMVETEDGERVVTWLISLDFPGGYRERLKEPVRTAASGSTTQTASTIWRGRSNRAGTPTSTSRPNGASTRRMSRTCGSYG